LGLRAWGLRPQSTAKDPRSQALIQVPSTNNGTPSSWWGAGCPRGES
jgi:hypothetical protein